MSEKKPITQALSTRQIAGKEVEILLDSHEAAAVLGVYPRSLQRMVDRGQISGVQVGKLWRFRPSAIFEWIDHGMAS